MTINNQIPARAKLLMAFEPGTPMTRRDAMAKANVSLPTEMRYLIQGDFLRPTAWEPRRPREFILSERGTAQQKHYRATLAL